MEFSAPVGRPYFLDRDSASVIDAQGFRPNVGIIVANDRGQVLWGRRLGNQDAWQFPQGGIHERETPEQALYRELHEEVGLSRDDVELIATTRGWLRYRLPRRLVRQKSQPVCVGQKQKWFLLRLTAPEDHIQLDNDGHAEFDDWRWVSYWYPLGKVIAFKREVYRRALRELAGHHSQLEAAGEVLPLGSADAVDSAGKASC